MEVRRHLPSRSPLWDRNYGDGALHLFCSLQPAPRFGPPVGGALDPGSDLGIVHPNRNAPMSSPSQADLARSGTLEALYGKPDKVGMGPCWNKLPVTRSHATPTTLVWHQIGHSGSHMRRRELIAGVGTVAQPALSSLAVRHRLLAIYDHRSSA